MNLNKDIKNDGFILLTNQLSDSELEYGLSSIEGKKVDYKKTKKFIDEIFLHKIKKKSGVITDPYYVKFRFSNNNNSNDASTFHGDLYNNTGSELMPIYTCLCYFDDAQLEIIPGSHKYNRAGWSIQSYNKRQLITVKRGDILIFHANTHHRGVKFNKTINRRLLQVFEVFPDKETYDENISKVITVKTHESLIVKNCINPIMYEMAKYPCVINTLTMIHYVLMYNDVLYKMVLMDVNPREKKNNYITYEPSTRLIFNDLVEKENLNINIICDENAKSVSYSNYYLYLIIFWIAMFIVLYLIFKSWKSDYKVKISKMARKRRL